MEERVNLLYPPSGITKLATSSSVKKLLAVYSKPSYRALLTGLQISTEDPIKIFRQREEKKDHLLRGVVFLNGIS